MKISFEKLFVLLTEQGKNKNWLRNNGVLPNTVDRLVKGKSVSTDIIARICGLLNCQPGDIMEYVDDEGDSPQ